MALEIHVSSGGTVLPLGQEQPVSLDVWQVVLMSLLMDYVT